MQFTRTINSGPVRTGLIALLATALILALAVPATAHGRYRAVQREDVLTQDESGVYQRNGARMRRNHYAFSVRWKIRTPRPGTYTYPTADQIPDGAPPHPRIRQGYPEVFTLWAFVFNYPKRCTDPCDFDDIGPDTAAEGGIYQLDGTIAYKRRIKMGGKVRIGQAPAAGAMLSNPRGAEIHVAMAAHGKAYRGARLARQLNGAVGTPPSWWAAIFEPRHR